MPKKENLKKVMVIGSGPIIIGQAAEFDYAGSQACRALKEEGLEVVLVNSNPATIMTDVHVADRVYVEPISDEFIEKIIKRECPDSLLATLGGQVGHLHLREYLHTVVREARHIDNLGILDGQFHLVYLIFKMCLCLFGGIIFRIFTQVTLVACLSNSGRCLWALHAFQALQFGYHLIVAFL